MQTISSQRYIDEDTVQQKLDAQDFTVAVSPVFEFDGQQFRVVMDGHHSLAAAQEAGVQPEFIEQDATENDKIGLLNVGKIDEFMEAAWIDSDWYDVETGAGIW